MHTRTAVARDFARRQIWAERLLVQLGLDSRAMSDRLAYALASVRRELFVGDAFAFRAYEDLALPIGAGQTISKPSTVALMLAHLDIQPGEKCFEVGVGSGYVVALLRALGAEVCGVERHASLGYEARRRLESIGYHDVLIRVGDGMRGWRERSPFDAIVISAAIRSAPHSLFAQLRPGGRLVAPVIDDEQQLAVQRLRSWRVPGQAISADPQVFEHEDLGPCQFVLAA